MPMSFTTRKPDTPEHVAFATVGRVARAITYPAISRECANLTLLELNALVTIAHVNRDMCVGMKVPQGATPLFDTACAMRLAPGCGQAFFNPEDFTETFSSLAEKSLVRLRRHPQPAPFFCDHSIEVTLTAKGKQLVEAMAGSLSKILCMLKDIDTAEALRRY